MPDSTHSPPIARARPWLVAAAVCAFVVAGIAPAIDRAAGATAKPTVHVSHTVVKRWHAITVTGSHWPRGASVQLLIGPPQSEATNVARVRTTSSGTFRRRIVPPAWVQARAGRWVLLACRRECRDKAAETFRITR